MPPFLRSLLVAAALVHLCSPDDALGAKPAPLPVAALNRVTPVDFNAEIAPFLRRNCLACHNETKAKANLILETPEAIRKGGDTGPAVEPGNTDASLLFTLATHQEDPVMPPAGNKSHAVDLKPGELALLKLWIHQGAKGTARLALPAPANWRRSDHEPIYTVAITPDGRYAACGRGHQVHFYDLTLQMLVATPADPALGGAAHQDFVHSVAFSRDGTLATGGYREVKLWRLPEVTPLADSPSPGQATAFAESGDGRWRALGLADGTIHLIDLSRPAAKPVALKDHTGRIRALAFLPDHSTLVSGGADQTLRRRQAASPLQSQSIPVPAEVVSLTPIEEGARIASGALDNKIRLIPLSAFDPGTDPAQAQIAELPGGSAPASILRSLRLGGVECLLSAGAETTVRIWNLASRNVQRQISTGAPVTALDLSPDGSKLIVQRSVPGPARVSN